MLLKAENIKKGYGIQELFEIEKLEIDQGQRIGLIGLNGCGKSTLLKTLQGAEAADQGTVTRYCDIAVIGQMGEREEAVDGQLISKMGLRDSACMSGGERTRLAIAAAFSKETQLLFADEPTTNLDVAGIQKLERLLLDYQGAFLLISHDRTLLDKTCNQIWEIEECKLRVFPGNYSRWKEQKERERVQAQADYEKYQDQKHHLETAMYQVREEGRSILGRPRKMSNSEWQLYKGNVTNKQARVQNRGKVMKKRIDMLEVKEKPTELPKLQMRLGLTDPIGAKNVISVKNLTVRYDDRTVLHNAEMEIKSNCCTVMVGANGAGKSTLIRQIMEQNAQVRINPGAKIGYFAQDHETLDHAKSVLENVETDAILPRHLVRTVLANLYLKETDLNKPIAVLSGGERAKVTLAKLLVSDVNVLILDEPTNHIDIYVAEALEALLELWEGTLLIITHDRRLTEKLADRLLFVKAGQVSSFEGSLSDWEEAQQRRDEGEQRKELDKTILSMRIAELTARLQRPRKGDRVESLQAELEKMMKDYYQHLK